MDELYEQNAKMYGIFLQRRRYFTAAFLPVLIQQMLRDLAEPTDDPRRIVEEHLSECADCKRTWEVNRAIRQHKPGRRHHDGTGGVFSRACGRGGFDSCSRVDGG